MSQMPQSHSSSGTSDHPHRYNADYAGKLELRWQGEWEKAQAFKVPNPGEPGFDASRPKYFCMDMFPYPSGAGLHVGHPEGYTATDIICRYKRMKGFNVLHPMGWDAFGLPAEQYAIQTGVHPAITTRKAIDTFRRQLKRFGFCYDWSREFATIDEDYYRWTQWIFLQIYNAWYDKQSGKAANGKAANREGRARPISELIEGLENGSFGVGPSGELIEVTGEGPGSLGVFDGSMVGLRKWHELSPRERHAFIDNQRLAYIDEQVVNWCPKLGTALANEEVIDGKSERGGFPVLRKPLRQWMFRITAFAERLLKDLDGLDWPHSTRTMQAEWIGRSEGAEIDFELEVGGLGGTDRGGTDLRDVSSSGFSRVPVLFDQEEAVQLDPKDFVARDPYPTGGDSPTDLMRLVRNLPHLELPGATYFVTWRAADGVTLSESERDAVVDALAHFDGKRCRAYALCVMPDHVHWIVRPYDGESVVKLAASVKQFTATKLNKERGRSGSLWQDESFDHIIRGKGWFSEFAKYVVRNPVEAALVRKPSEYRWTWLHVDVLGGGGAGHVPEVRATQEIQSLRVFTTRPDTIFGATYMVVAPEHELIEQILGSSAGPTGHVPEVLATQSTGHVPEVRATQITGHVPEVRATQDSVIKEALRSYVTIAKNRSDVERQENKEKTGVFTGVYAINPATKKKIPVWTADYVLTGYGTGAIMAVPAQDERDWEFAKKFDLPIVRTVQPPEGFGDEPFVGEGPAINSDFLNGLRIAAAKEKIIAWLEEEGIGTRKINYKLRDWLFSRQRYWGEPFPIVFDSHGDPYGVSEAALPVTLPKMDDYHPEESDEPKPLLGKAKEWVKTTAGAAGVSSKDLPSDAPVTRETNTMPGWAGSCWYYLRYCDPKNDRRFCSPEAERYWMGGGRSANEQSRKAADEDQDGAGGVDLYIGGSEHAVLHLLYARFWHKALFDLGFVSTKEPFQKLFHQGLITSFSYQRPDKSLVPTDQVEERGEGQFFEKATGAKLVQVTAKMSKSLKNVVNPDDVIAEFGADTFRLYEMYMGPLDASKPWNPRDITGCFRFLQRAWRLCVDEQSGALRFADAADDAVERLLHRTVAKVEGDIERLAFNTAIAALIQFVNETTGEKPTLTRSQVERFTLMLAPFAPHMAEEVWSKLGGIGFASHGAWPIYDEAMLKDSSVEMPVQIMGKIKARITVAADADTKAVEAAALADVKVQEAIAGKTVKRVIVVPGKMVNLVVG